MLVICHTYIVINVLLLIMTFSGTSYAFDKIDSDYTQFIASKSEELMQNNLKEEIDPEQLIKYKCIKNPEKPKYIGIEQYMEIKAPFNVVKSIMDDVNNYKELLVGYKDIHITETDKNSFVVFFEQTIPLFFVSNVKFELVYNTDESVPNKKLYRYQLKKSNRLKYDDGLIYLEKSNNITKYKEFDFWDADWGMVWTSKAWRESIEETILSDLVVKIQAENPDKTYKEAQKEAKKMLNKIEIKC